MDEEPAVTTSPPHQPHIYRPIPRRNWSQSSHNASNNVEPLSPTSPAPSRIPSSSDFLAQLNARLLGARNSSNGNVQDGWNEGGSLAGSASRNKSFLNMTSSTLFGIYDDVTMPNTATDTPWGLEAETPAREKSSLLEGWNGNGDANGNGIGAPDAGLAMKFQARNTPQRIPQSSSSTLQRNRRRKQSSTNPVAIAAKVMTLFFFGVIYGAIVSLLHDTRELAAVRVGGFNQGRWMYFASWGVAGVVLGSLLPYVDFWWDGMSQEEESKVPVRRAEHGVGEQWNQVVRSVGAFVGIAYAIRKLPWQSTLQLTITLALVNPALWYLLDRSKTGLTVSTLFSSLLTSILLFSNPDVLPSPAVAHATYSSPASGGGNGHAGQEGLFAGVVSYDSLAVATWVGSVLFCSCVCFGSIGRRLGVLKEWR